MGEIKARAPTLGRDLSAHLARMYARTSFKGPISVLRFSGACYINSAALLGKARI